LFSEVLKALPEESAVVLQRQMQDVASVYRDGGEVIYRSKRGKSHSAPPFAAKDAELKFATVRFSLSNPREIWVSDFFLIMGHLGALVFTPKPPSIREASEVNVKDAIILRNPDLPVAQVTSEPIARENVTLPAWLRAVEKTHEVRDLHEPLSPDHRQRTVKNITAELPPDYLELMEQAEGLEVGNIGILGLSQAYEVVMPDWTYYLLAEVNNVGMLGVKTHSKDGVLASLRFHKRSGSGDALDQEPTLPVTDALFEIR